MAGTTRNADGWCMRGDIAKFPTMLNSPEADPKATQRLFQMRTTRPIAVTTVCFRCQPPAIKAKDPDAAPVRTARRVRRRPSRQGDRRPVEATQRVPHRSR